MSILKLVAISILLSGCSLMNRNDCETANWQNVGFNDGRNGYTLDYLERRERSCNKFGINIDQSAYGIGRKNGLKIHCSIAHFYFAGEMGFYAEPKVCPADQNSGLLKAYNEGQKLNLLKRQRDKVNKDIRDFN